MFAKLRDRFHPLWRLRRQGWFRALQRSVDFPLPCRLSGGLAFYAYILRDFSFFAGQPALEEGTVRVFAALLRECRPEVFLDVGANLGLYSWRVAGELPGCQLWLFEPDPANFALLGRTIRRNRLASVRTMPKAVAAASGHAEFLLDDVSGATGALQNHSEASQPLHQAYGLNRKVTVETISLDSLLGQFPAGRLLLKIDVEGAEGQVLAGAARLLRERRPVAIFECFTPAHARGFFEAGYAVYNLAEDANYLAVPAENVAVHVLAASLGLNALPPPE